MIDVVVTKKTREAEAIYSYELAAADGSALPPFAAGAHIDVQAAGMPLRQYSLCNHPEEQQRYQIGVLRDPASRGGSAALVDTVALGDTLQISAPRLLFPLQAGAKKSILFAGGIGITPILCMAERLAQTSADFTLHYCARSRSHMAFRERILASSFAARAELHFDDGAEAQKLQTAQAIGAPEAGVHLYVCGPAGFMAHVIDTAHSLGWPDEQIHREYFYAAPQEHDSDQSFTLKIASTGQLLTVAPEQTAVAVLHAAGFEIPLSCEQGVCGTCLVAVLEGEPDHRDMFLTKAEHAQNQQFTPCCSRARSATLVLDL